MQVNAVFGALNLLFEGLSFAWFEGLSPAAWFVSLNKNRRIW